MGVPSRMLRDQANPFVRLLWQQREVIAKLKQPFLDLSALEPEEKEQRTLQAIALMEALRRSLAEDKRPATPRRGAAAVPANGREYN
jgi:hypothetical protein